MGPGCFLNSAIKSIDFNNCNITKIENNTFSYSSISGKVIIPDSVEEIGDAAFNVTKITSVFFGNSLRTIGMDSFAHCKSLSCDIDLPESLVSMGPYEDFNDSYRENVVDPTLKFYGKTVEQFNKDVLDEMNSYLEYMKSRSLPSDDIREENHIGEENEWFSDPFDLQNEDNI
jgi:hypothetical protein